MGCNCGKRRDLTAQAIKNVRTGNFDAARQNAQRFVKTLQLDARNIARRVGRSTLMKRPPSR